MSLIMGVTEPELLQDLRQGIASLGRWAAVAPPELDGPARTGCRRVEGVPEPVPLRKGRRPPWGSVGHAIWLYAGFADSDLRAEWKIASREAQKSEDPDSVWLRYLQKRQRIIERFEAKERQLLEKAEQAYDKRLWKERRRSARRALRARR